MTRNAKFFDDLAKMVGGAVSAMGNLKEQLTGEVKERVDDIIAHMDMVTREEFDLVQDMLKKSRLEQEQLKKRLAALESKIANKNEKQSKKRSKGK